jgi:ABC-type glutathione transport system ATPase component
VIRSLVEARGLSLAWPTPRGAVCVLDRADLSIGVGEAVGLVGPSGSGKTTLGLALLGLATRCGARVGGELRWRREVVGPPQLARLRGRAIGYVPQEPRAALDPYMTCGAQIAEALGAAGVVGTAARERVAALLAEVGLDPAVAGTYPHRLSGGMCQRVLVAAALAGDPLLVVADEPTASLDALTRARVLALLDDVRRARGLALLLISHDRRAVDALCDRVLEISDRALVAGERRVLAAASA